MIDPRLGAIDDALRAMRYADARDLADAALLDASDAVRDELVAARLIARARLGEPDVERARALWADGGARVRRSRAVYALAISLFAASRPGASEPRFHEATAEARALGDRTILWRALAYLGLLRMLRQDFGPAVELLREAATGLEADGDLREAADRWLSLGNILLMRTPLHEAEAACDRAEACAAAFPDQIAECFRFRAQIHRRVDDLDRTRALLEQGLSVVPADAARSRSRLLNDLGDVHRAQGRREEARAHFLASLRARPDDDDILPRLNLALLELDDGRREAAREALRPLLLRRRRHWYSYYAHAICVAAADDADDLDRSLDALDDPTRPHTITERDLLPLYRDAVSRWAARDVDRGARVALLHDAQARRLGCELAEAEAALRDLFDRGARVPLGPLWLDEEVRRGGMGQVWRGSVRRADGQVAVKLLSGGSAQDADVRAALARELHAVARLDHPHIVPLLDHGTIPAPLSAMTRGRLAADTPWLATRWAPHGTLEGWCGRRTYAEVAAALLQILDALSAAHAEGLLHLDVKPANVLVASEAPLVTWLADFGVARALGQVAEQPIAGTPAYMAPEQVRGLVDVYGPWTDLYAVGGAAVALVQGAPPFSGTSRELLRQQVVAEVPPLAPTIAVPDGFDAWIRRLLAKDPARRFACAADAMAALQDLGEAGEPGPGEAGARPMTARPTYDGAETTFVLEEPWAAPPDPEPLARPSARRPIPERLPSLGVRPAPLPALAEAASRLLPLRRVPMVGRLREREALWSALRGTRDGARVGRRAPPTCCAGWPPSPPAPAPRRCCGSTPRPIPGGRRCAPCSRWATCPSTPGCPR